MGHTNPLELRYVNYSSYKFLEVKHKKHTIIITQNNYWVIITHFVTVKLVSNTIYRMWIHGKMKPIQKLNLNHTLGSAM